MRKPSPTKRLTDRDFDELVDEVLSEVVNDYPDMFDEFRGFLRQAAHDPSLITALKKYNHLPVSPREFVDSPMFMNKPNAMWPAVMDAFSELNSGRYVESVLTGAIGVGKCLGRGTPVLMYDGTVKAVEDVQPGDLLMGPDSYPRRVRSIARGREELFRVRQRGGEDYVVNRSHILSLRYTTSGRYGNGGLKNIAVHEYLGLNTTHRNELKGWKPDGVHFPGKEVYDPYLLGLWLGDGHSDGPKFTSMDKEIVDYLAEVAKRHGLIMPEKIDERGNKARLYSLVQYEWQASPKGNYVREWLRAYGLLWNKHVPHVYKTASVDDRLKLLAGLIDTDGHLTAHGCFEIIQKRKILADDIAFVGRSCGFRVRVTKKLVNGVTYYRCLLSGDLSVIPTRLPRKKAKPRRQVKNINRWGISLESLGVGDYFGFELEGNDRLFLLGDFTVTHNTHVALYTQAYQLYVLSCLRNPHDEFDLDSSSEIQIVFQSITKDLAKGVDYQRFRAMIEQSPYFQRIFPFDQSISSEMRFPKRIIVKPISGSDTGAIGQNVIGGIIDEINFMSVVENSKNSHDGGTYDQAVQNYSSIARRRESRFMKLGTLPGMLCLVSSRNYPGQFTDKKEAEAKTNPRIYIYDKRVWEIKPWLFSFHEGVAAPAVVELYGKDTPLWFEVFIGDETRKPRIIRPGEQVSVSDRRLVMSVPIEYLKEFENDLLASLRDIAGVATQALHPFILNTEAVTECFGTCESILSRDDCDFVDTKVLMYPKRIVNPTAPRFIHIDLALTKDSAGISCAHVPGFKNMDRGGYFETLPIIQYDFVLEVRPPRGGEIEYENIRRLVYKLRDVLRLPVKWISFDQFQSTDSQQILQREGFITGQQSMDATTKPYDLLKQALYDRRVVAPKHDKAQKELVTLEFNPKKNKIDHSPHGSKDVSDSMAGAAIGLTRMREIWSMYGISTYKIPKSVLELTSTKRSIGSSEQENPVKRPWLREEGSVGG